ncbi:MAG: TnpV protein [Oscillospiraceae bacterium]|nr:TnpV protein [Bacteroidaceae bacterium]MBQ7902192.1 TnpV protein [Oscillospiraceae bacterium]
MDKYIFDESNGLWYELQGDYYIPCLILSEEETQPIGLWGQRHKQYLKEHRHIVYTTMLIDGTLNRYLADINQQAEQMFHRLIDEMAQKQGVTEQLKAENQMEWVQQMNACKAQAEEIVKFELIYD